MSGDAATALAAIGRTVLQQAIVKFDQDEAGDFIAVLVCGHRQHVRHRPPFVERPWVLSQAGRQAVIGTLLNCQDCDAAVVQG